LQRTVEEAEIDLNIFRRKQEEDVGHEEDEDEDQVGLQRPNGSDLLRLKLSFSICSRRDCLERKYFTQSRKSRKFYIQVFKLCHGIWFLPHCLILALCLSFAESLAGLEWLLNLSKNPIDRKSLKSKGSIQKW
jgi:hypothetical protein